MDPLSEEKRSAAEAAAREVVDGSVVGLGTGSTVAYLLPALARRNLSIRCVATSPGTETAARSLGLEMVRIDAFDRVDIAIDGADQVAPDLWLAKGGGGAHTREKVVAEAADRFVVIVSSDKLVDRLGPPVAVEVMRFGVAATLRRLRSLGPVEPRDGPPTPEGNVLVDFVGAIDHPPSLARTLESVPGVVGHGLFSAELVSVVLVGRTGGAVDRLGGRRQA